MKIIVTGATGFLGRRFTKFIEQDGIETVKLSSKDIDITRPLKLPEGDVLYHLAANSRIYWARQNFIDDFKMNALGTLNVIEAAHRSRISKVVYISSVLVYENLYGASETDKVGSNGTSGPYGLSKLVGELYIKQLSREKGMEYVILRPSGLYGSGMKKNTIFDMVTGFVLEKPISLFHDINSEFDFIHVEDVAQAMKMALGWKNEIFNVSHGEGIKLSEVYSILSEIEGKMVPVNSSGSLVRLKFSNCKIRGKGWKENYSLEAGLKETIEYFRRVL